MYVCVCSAITTVRFMNRWIRRLVALRRCSPACLSYVRGPLPGTAKAMVDEYVLFRRRKNAELEASRVSFGRRQPYRKYCGIFCTPAQPG